MDEFWQILIILFPKVRMTETINLKNLIPILINASAISCEIMDRSSRNYAIKHKDGNDPVT